LTGFFSYVKGILRSAIATASLNLSRLSFFSKAVLRGKKYSDLFPIRSGIRLKTNISLNSGEILLSNEG
jgi:hypothetical protein